MHKIYKQMEFLHEIDKVKEVLRQSLVMGERRENDAEHSWHMCMVALTLKEYFIGEVDMERCLKMMLMHDVVEIYAGDTPAFGAARPDKRVEEEKAARKIFAMLPKEQGDEFLKLWLEFEDCETDDARYANTCDVFQGFMQNLTSDGHTWKKFEVTLDRVLKRAENIKKWAPEVFEEFVYPEIEKYIEKGYIKR